MTGEAGDHLQELDLVERCLEGDSLAINDLKKRQTPHLESILRVYGADAGEVEEVMAALWRDCLASRVSRDPLFVRYNGAYALRNWLAAIVINRWISLKRADSARERMHQRVAAERTEVTRDPALPDPELSRILEQAIRGALAECGAEEMVILQLVHSHGLNQKEIARLLGWTESTTSRTIRRTQESLSRAILKRVGQADPHLEVCWEDFLRLCESVSLLQADAAL
jgi:RNA polymerase sigma factor (sigma-70 family)